MSVDRINNSQNCLKDQTNITREVPFPLLQVPSSEVIEIILNS